MVNYPGGIRKSPAVKFDNAQSHPKSSSKTSPINFAGRGMSFEADINATNDYYLTHGLAVVHKKPTPVQIVHVEYPKRSRAKITEAYFREASTTDYSGVYKGHYLDFEAKETKQKLSFPLKNFHPHQIEHMKAVLAQGAIAFVLLHFSLLDETYYFPASNLAAFYDVHKGLKSLPISQIRSEGQLISNQQIPRIPYLDIINQQLGLS
ncbi:MAG: Holliday junction resolvase RecU [Streptococcaceae bacterium]|jgi:recombination protein U|nr:Holliday junction resolvase RecU [Streptococcaceae bacterium]